MRPNYRTTSSLAALNVLGDTHPFYKLDNDTKSASSSMVTEASGEDLLTAYLKFKGANEHEVEHLEASFHASLAEQGEHFHDSFLMSTSGNDELHGGETKQHERDDTARKRNKHADGFVPLPPGAEDDVHLAVPLLPQNDVTSKLRKLIQEQQIYKHQEEQTERFDDLLERIASQHLWDKLGGQPDKVRMACRRSRLLSQSLPNLHWDPERMGSDAQYNNGIHRDPDTMTAPSIDTDGSDDVQSNNMENAVEQEEAEDSRSNCSDLGHPTADREHRIVLDHTDQNSSAKTHGGPTQIRLQHECHTESEANIAPGMDDSFTLHELLQSSSITQPSVAKLQSAAAATLARRRHNQNSPTRDVASCSLILDTKNNNNNDSLVVDVMAALILAAPRQVAAQLVQNANQMAALLRQQQQLRDAIKYAAQEQEKLQDLERKQRASKDRKSRSPSYSRRLRSSSSGANSKSQESKGPSSSKPKRRSFHGTLQLAALQPPQQQDDMTYSSRGTLHSKPTSRSDNKDISNEITKKKMKKNSTSSSCKTKSAKSRRLSSSTFKMESFEDSFRRMDHPSGTRRRASLPRSIDYESLSFLETLTGETSGKKARRSRRSRSRDTHNKSPSVTAKAESSRDHSRDSYNSLPVVSSKRRLSRDLSRDSLKSLPVAASTTSKTSISHGPSLDSHKMLPDAASIKIRARDHYQDSTQSLPTVTVIRGSANDSRQSLGASSTKSIEKSSTTISRRSNSKESRVSLPSDLTGTEHTSTSRSHSKDSRVSLPADSTGRKVKTRRRGYSKDARLPLSADSKSKHKKTDGQHSPTYVSCSYLPSDLPSKKSYQHRSTSKDSRQSVPTTPSTPVSKKTSPRSRSLSKDPLKSRSSTAAPGATKNTGFSSERSLSYAESSELDESSKSASPIENTKSKTMKTSRSKEASKTNQSSVTEIFLQSMPVLKLESSAGPTVAKAKKGIRSAKSDDAETTKSKARNDRFFMSDEMGEDRSKMRASSHASKTSSRSKAVGRKHPRKSKASTNADKITDEGHLDHIGKTYVSPESDISASTASRLEEFINKSTHVRFDSPSESLENNAFSMGTEMTEKIANSTAGENIPHNAELASELPPGDAAAADDFEQTYDVESLRVASTAASTKRAGLRNEFKRGSSTGALFGKLSWDFKASTAKKQPKAEQGLESKHEVKPKVARKRQHKRGDVDVSVSLHAAMDQLAKPRPRKSALHMSFANFVNDASIDSSTKSQLRERLRGVKNILVEGST